MTGKNKGFTLVEVLVAIIIIMIFLLIFDKYGEQRNGEILIDFFTFSLQCSRLL